ncbi:MAG: hypothetical protein ACLP7J_18905 [Streptosporangiaceae bacterium]
MTAIFVGSAGREHAGLASGVLNAARQAGAALGVALLDALPVDSGPGTRLSLHAPLTVAAAAQVLAADLAWPATRPDR